MTHPKIALVGAGQIGGTMALLASQQNLGDVVLIDVAEGMSQGKALDQCQAGAVAGYPGRITGSNDYSALLGADVVIITAGLPRKPGMSRDDLLQTNFNIIKDVAINVKKYCPKAFVIVITNPLDAMVYAFQKLSGLPPAQVVGMAGVLDSARFRFFLSEALNISMRDIHTLVLGGHGDTMVPLVGHTSVAGIPLPELMKQGALSQQKLDKIIERTRKGGAEIVDLLKNGSAFYAPAAAAIEMAESNLRNLKRLLPCAAHLTGQYKVKNLYVGVPIVIGNKGVEKIIELELSPQEQEMLQHSVKAVQELSKEIDGLI